MENTRGTRVGLGGRDQTPGCGQDQKYFLEASTELKGLPRHKHKTQVQRKSLGQKCFTKFGLPTHPQTFRTLHEFSSSSHQSKAKV